MTDADETTTTTNEQQEARREAAIAAGIAEGLRVLDRHAGPAVFGDDQLKEGLRHAIEAALDFQ